MSGADKSKQQGGGQSDARPAEAGQEPEWTKGLKRLYDSVVEEPLPDSFKELLSKLDEDDQ